LKKKRWLWITVSLVAALVLSVLGTEFYQIAKDGRSRLLAALEPEVYKDGRRQFRDAYLTDVYFENGKVCYTVVNNTPMKFSAGYNPDLYRKENGAWVPWDIWAEHIEPSRHIMPNTTTTRSSRVRAVSAKEDILGEYCLIYGYCMERCIVGYLTITEEMIDYMGIEGELYYTEDGIRQNTMLTLRDLHFDRYVVSYTVTNHTGIRQRGWYLPMIEKKIDGAWQEVKIPAPYVSEMYWSLENGESASGWFHMPHDGLALVGEYRFILGNDWCEIDPDGNRHIRYFEEMDHIVAELIITAEMLEGVV